MKLKWEKIHAQLRMSTDGRYAIAGRYTYYQGWTPYFLPDGKEGEWIALDGMYAGRDALEICRQICDEHNRKHNNIQQPRQEE